MAETPRNPGGRPRIVKDATSQPQAVSSWVKQQDFDRLCQIARTDRVSVSAVVRRIITRGLRQP